MKKISKHWLLAITAIMLVQLGARAERPQYFDLDWKIVEIRHMHPMEDFMNDILDLQYDQIIFEYNSLGPDMKTPVRLTASIAMPTAVYNKQASPRALVLYNQFTTAKHRERASQEPDVEYNLLLNKLQNLIVISPDLYGWTLTEDKPQAFCCPEITGRETSDAWTAAMEILKEKEYDYESLPIINIGYSAGGFSAMAVDKYFNANRKDVKFALTAAGGAPFDPTTVYENYVKTNYTRFPCALPLMVVAYKETYNLPMEYSDIFQEPLASNVENWILSKDYNTWEINGLIGEGVKVNQMLTPKGCDYTRVPAKTVYDKFRDNALCGPWPTWQPSATTQYFIFHSKGDTYMMNDVGIEMASYLDDHGCDYESDFYDWGDHVYYAGFVFLARVLLKTELTINDNHATEIIQTLLSNLNQYLEIADFSANAEDDGNNISVKRVRAAVAKASADPDHYYTTNGEPINGTPTQPGIYIKNGKKIIVLSKSSITGEDSTDSDLIFIGDELHDTVGDLNKDGNVSIADIMTLIDMILKK